LHRNCGSQDGQAIGVDAAGNCYFTAYFNGTISIGAAANQTVANNSALYQYCVGKFDGDGNPAWLVKGQVVGDAEPRGLAVDRASGDVYVAGFWNGANAFVDGGQYPALFKYDSNGALDWTQIGYGSSSQQINAARGVAVDAAGCVYLTGSYHDNSLGFYNFVDGFHKFSAPSGATKLFVAKYCPYCSTNCISPVIAVPCKTPGVHRTVPGQPCKFYRHRRRHAAVLVLLVSEWHLSHPAGRSRLYDHDFTRRHVEHPSTDRRAGPHGSESLDRIFGLCRKRMLRLRDGFVASQHLLLDFRGGNITNSPAQFTSAPPAVPELSIGGIFATISIPPLPGNSSRTWRLRNQLRPV